jgi:hypothetical protein
MARRLGGTFDRAVETLLATVRQRGKVVTSAPWPWARRWD